MHERLTALLHVKPYVTQQNTNCITLIYETCDITGLSLIMTGCGIGALPNTKLPTYPCLAELFHLQ